LRGEIGDGTFGMIRLTPVQVSNLADVAQPAACPPPPTAGTPPNPGPATAEIRGSAPIHELPTTPNCGCNPVNDATGNFWHTFTDLSVPGRGISLVFTRTYNSLSAGQNGRLGFGWTDSYNVFFTTDASSNITVFDENGAATLFTFTATGYQAPSRVLATLVKNADGTFTLTRKDKTKLIFSPTGQLIKETDRNGYTTTLAYLNGKLSTVTDPAGRALTFTYGANGLLLGVSDPLNRSVAFQYDLNANLAQATDVAGGLTKFTYDPGHLLLTMTDPRNGVVTNTYDTSGRVVTQSDPLNRVTKFSYGPNSTTITHPNGNVTVEQFQNNALVLRTEGAGTARAVSWSYSYDSTSLGITAVTDPNGHVTKNTLDANGNLLSQTDALNRITTFTYNAFNEVLTVKDPLNVTTTNTYDANGNLTSTTRPLIGTNPLQSATTTYRYDAARAGDLIQKSDPNGKIWQYAYDQYGNPVKAIDPLNNTTSYGFDLIGRMTSRVSPKGNVVGANPATFTTSFAYNAFGDLTLVTDPLGRKTVSDYDPNRNLLAVTDANLHKTSYMYDGANQRIQVNRVDGTTLKLSYDGNGNMAGQTDALNHTTSYGYDPLNRKISTTDPLLRKITYGYDGVGNRASLVDTMNRSTSFRYDAANQLIGIMYSDGTTPNVSFTYDADGQRQSMTDGTGQSSYTYDSLRRLTKSVNGAGQAVGYGYDLKGQLTSITFPAGTNTANRTYDDVGRMASVSDWLTHTTSFGYDVNSNLITQAYPNGTTASFSYDAADQLIGITDSAGATQFLSFTYTRDNIGLLTAENANTYGYDPLNRVTSSVAGATTTSFGYDAGDHLTQVGVTGSPTTTLAYDAADQLTTLTKMSGADVIQKLTFTYDAGGSRTQQTDLAGVATNYGYDQAVRLTTYGTAAQYAYNGDGLRVKKTVSAVAEPFTWDVAEGLPLLIGDDATSYVTGPGGLPLEQIAPDGSVIYYHQDQLGSTRALTDATGTVVATYDYDPYGNLASPPAGPVNPFRYAGQYTDSESALQYLRVRYYDPSTEQFISRDPLSSVTREPYAYVRDNPLNGTDPTGLCNVNPFSGDSCLGQAAGAAGPVAKEALHIALDLAAVPPYAAYYASYNVMHAVNQFGDRFGPVGTVASRVIDSPLLIPQAIGLVGDVAIDWVKGHTVNNESTCDEGKKGYINPLHDYVPGPLKGPQVYLPGVHSDGHFDWEW